MPPASDPNLLARLVLSHRDKVLVALRQLEQGLKEGAVNQAEYARRRDRLTRELSVAEANIERYRARIRAHVESAESESRLLIEEQGNLETRIASGSVSPQQANDRNREILERLHLLQLELSKQRARIEANNAESLGGFIDLPLDRYVTELNASSIEAPYTGTGAVIVSAVACAAAFVSVFLPWLASGIGSVSLMRMHSAIGATGISSVLPDPVQRFIWLLYIAVVLAAAVCIRGEGRPPWAWAMLSLGAVMVAIGMLPGLLVGRGASAGSALFVLASYRIGAWLYVASGIALLITGALRVSPWGDDLRHAVRSSAMLAGVAILSIGLVALILVVLPDVATVSFTARLSNPSKDAVIVECSNTGAVAGLLHIPWPEGGAATVSGLDASRSFGIDVYVRERNAQTFRELPVAQDLWSAPSGVQPAVGLVEVPPGRTIETRLDLRRIGNLGVDAVEVRLVYSRGSGLVLGSFETPLGESTLSIPAASREPAILPVPPGELHPEVIASPAPASAPHPEPSLTFVYSGQVGDKAVIGVRSTGAEERPRSLAIGDPIAEDWALESVDGQKRTATVVHVLTGTKIVLHRGEPTPIVAPE